MSGRTLRYILVGALALAIGIPSVAIGFGEGRTLLLGKRNPSPNASRALNSETEIIASNGTYGTRQSNKRDGDGGGAIYGCRSNPGAEPCVRANNLKGGRAFEFETVGKEGGRIEVGDTTGAPFTTNATGTATGLNADKVDGKEAADFAATGDLLTAVVAANGTLERGRGATAAALTNAPSERFRVTFNRDVSTCAYTVSPQGDAAEQAFGVRSPADNKNQVVIDQPDPGGARAFHLQVIC
jgi:hypothetical protein